MDVTVHVTCISLNNQHASSVLQDNTQIKWCSPEFIHRLVAHDGLDSCRIELWIWRIRQAPGYRCIAFIEKNRGDHDPQQVMESAHLRSPSHCALPGRSPQPASFGEVLALLQLLLPNVAPHQCAAMLIHPMPKVLARHTNAWTTAVIQLPFVHKTPFLHNPSLAVHMY